MRAIRYTQYAIFSVYGVMLEVLCAPSISADMF
ncbi:hypothetical protein BZA03_108151 [Alteromonas sp. I10]|nr:hypothetical protein BZA03_108151 [Alteromonas sp. I10]